MEEKCAVQTHLFRVQKNVSFLRSSTDWVLLGFSLTGFFRFFYLNEQLGSLLADLAHQLSFYLYSPLLQIVYKNCKFITYWSLEAVNISKFLVITGMRN